MLFISIISFAFYWLLVWDLQITDRLQVFVKVSFGDAAAIDALLKFTIFHK